LPALQEAIYLFIYALMYGLFKDILVQNIASKETSEFILCGKDLV